MTGLQNCMKKSPSADEGAQLFVSEALSRYARRDPATLGHDREVVCHWRVQYATRNATAFTFVFLPLMMLAGHMFVPMRRMNFVTYHYLSPAVYKRFKRRRAFSSLLNLLGVGGIMVAGFGLVISIVGVLVSIFDPTPEPGQPPVKLWPVALAAAVFMLCFIAAVRFQRFLWKVGEPPDATCFNDTRVRLESARFN
jgi:hypothetical protein